MSTANSIVAAVATEEAVSPELPLAKPARPGRLVLWMLLANGAVTVIAAIAYKIAEMQNLDWYFWTLGIFAAQVSLVGVWLVMGQSRLRIKSASLATVVLLLTVAYFWFFEDAIELEAIVEASVATVLAWLFLRLAGVRAFAFDPAAPPQPANWQFSLRALLTLTTVAAVLIGVLRLFKVFRSDGQGLFDLVVTRRQAEVVLVAICYLGAPLLLPWSVLGRRRAWLRSLVACIAIFAPIPVICAALDAWFVWQPLAISAIAQTALCVSSLLVVRRHGYRVARMSREVTA